VRLGDGIAAPALRRRAPVPPARNRDPGPGCVHHRQPDRPLAGWTTYWKLLAAIALGFILFGISAATRSKEERPALDFAAGYWMIPWLLALGAISYFSSFEGGQDKLVFGVDMGVTAVLALGVYFWALHSRLDPEKAKAYFDETAEEAKAEGKELAERESPED
jgi:hypothetical protein